MNDGKERFCDGCFTLVAPCDPEAFSVAGQWFHNGNEAMRSTSIT